MTDTKPATDEQIANLKGSAWTNTQALALIARIEQEQAKLAKAEGLLKIARCPDAVGARRAAYAGYEWHATPRVAAIREGESKE